MAKKILIITTSQDVGASYIISALRKHRGVKVYRFNTEEFPTKVKINIYHDGTGELVSNFVFPEQGKLNSTEIFSVYYRREGEAVLDKSIKDNTHKLFARTEITGALDTVWDTLNCLWVNHPRYSTSLMTKVGQTHYGGLSGLRVPKTIVSTNQEELLNFYKKCNGKVVAKQLGNARGAQDWIEGRLYTQKILPEHLSIFKNAYLAPVMLQEAIDKDFELRISIVGDKFFAVKIDSQAKKETSVDWRVGPIGTIPHSIYKLPRDIKTKLLALHKTLKLIYSGTDMIVTPSGEYVLLELNPNGEYVWTEVLTGAPITEAICKLLIKGESINNRGANPSINQ